MFGYRLIRESEYDRKQKYEEFLQEQRVTLLRELAVATASAASKTTMADLLIARVNVLEYELAQRKHVETGLPQTVPAIGKGSTVQNAALGAGVDLFEDVGDERAQQLRDQGLLHDELAPIDELMAPGRALASQVGE